MTIGTFDPLLRKIDASIASTAADLSTAFSGIPLDVFGLLFLESGRAYPNIAKALPQMPSAEVQTAWTGAHGRTLMVQSCAFVKSVVTAYERVVGRPITDALVLDYGCGWGRLSRLLLRYVAAQRLFAIDPWDESIRLCREAGLPVNLAISDYVPNNLPVGSTKFDFIFAFSVFTHLSEKCAAQVMRTLRRHVVDDALVAITIRPPEYWDIHKNFPA